MRAHPSSGVRTHATEAALAFDFWLSTPVRALLRAAGVGRRGKRGCMLCTLMWSPIPPVADYRIRESSAELLGDLLMRLTGKEYMPLLEEGEENAPDSPLIAVPPERQRALLAALYIARNDVHVTVRQAASFVWKSLVSNPPRALRVILPALTGQLLEGLSSENEERQQVSARALGELVSKMSERVLPKLIPILQQGLANGDTAHRQGVCLGLAELMSSAGRESVTHFLSGARRALAPP